MLVVSSTNKGTGAIHMEITTLGIDLAKSVFQLHGTDAGGKVVLRKRLRRNQVLEFMSSLPRCLVGIEACGTSHYWAREIQALGHARRVRPSQASPSGGRSSNRAETRLQKAQQAICLRAIDASPGESLAQLELPELAR